MIEIEMYQRIKRPLSVLRPVFVIIRLESKNIQEIIKEIQIQ